MYMSNLICFKHGIVTQRTVAFSASEDFYIYLTMTPIDSVNDQNTMYINNHSSKIELKTFILTIILETFAKFGGSSVPFIRIPAGIY